MIFEAFTAYGLKTLYKKKNNVQDRVGLASKGFHVAIFINGVYCMGVKTNFVTLFVVISATEIHYL